MEEPARPSRRHRLPATFRSLLPLRVLNVIALATSLAAATGTGFGRLLGGDQAVIASTALPTFVFSLAWALAMRHRKTVGIRTKIRVGWLWSVPLAAANGATAYAIIVSNAGPEDHLDFITGFIVGGTFGAIVWIPCLFVVLVLYGVPIAKSQALAERGLAGEERGERIVGLVSAVIALVALGTLSPAVEIKPFDAGLAVVARPLVLVFAAVGSLSGLAAAVLATYRDRVRRAFVRDVEAGNVQGFRVDTSNEGKVLVRVTSQGAGYRAATFDEEVYGLGDEVAAAGRALGGER